MRIRIGGNRKTLRFQALVQCGVCVCSAIDLKLRHVGKSWMNFDANRVNRRECLSGEQNWKFGSFAIELQEVDLAFAAARQLADDVIETRVLVFSPLEAVR